MFSSLSSDLGGGVFCHDFSIAIKIPVVVVFVAAHAVEGIADGFFCLGFLFLGEFGAFLLLLEALDANVEDLLYADHVYKLPQNPVNI